MCVEILSNSLQVVIGKFPPSKTKYMITSDTTPNFISQKTSDCIHYQDGILSYYSVSVNITHSTESVLKFILHNFTWWVYFELSNKF